VTRPAYTIKTAAEVCTVSQDIITAHIRSGAIRAFDAGTGRGKRRWRIPADALDEFITARSNVPPPTPTPRRRKQSPTEVTRYY
jgi:excisionase family DNA binding protein